MNEDITYFRKVIILYSLLKQYNIVSKFRLIIIAFTIDNLEINSKKKNNMISIFFTEFHKKFLLSRNKIKDYCYALNTLIKENICSSVNDEIICNKNLKLMHFFDKGIENILNEISKISDDTFVRMVIQYV